MHIKNLSGSCDCISTFQVEVEDFDNEIFVLSVEAHDKEEASTIAERICAESEITVYPPGMSVRVSDPIEQKGLQTPASTPWDFKIRVILTLTPADDTSAGTKQF